MVVDTDLGFPRLYAAASLKLVMQVNNPEGRCAFSAALCRGLIEATACSGAG